MQLNPNPNNKATQGIEAPTTFQTYLITPVGLNEIQLRSGRVINPIHSPIITEEDYEPSRGDAGGSEVDATLRTTDIEQFVTSVTIDPQRNVTTTTTNSCKVDTPVTTDSTVVMQDPLYPQRLVEPRMTSQAESNFLRELQNLHVRIHLLLFLKRSTYLC